MHGEIERQLGRSVDWNAEFEDHYRDSFEKELRPVDGTNEALDAITVPCCVASSASHEKMRFTLGLTGLWEHFDGRVFSVDEVERGKPAPDLFLYTAQRMGADPHRCAVIEDSVAGVTAGVAAGMHVFAFAGSVTSASHLSQDGVVTFSDMRSLPALLD